MHQRVAFCVTSVLQKDSSPSISLHVLQEATRAAAARQQDELHASCDRVQADLSSKTTQTATLQEECTKQQEQLQTQVCLV